VTAYTAERDAAGRSPIWVLELDVKQCANDYGISPCAATLSGDSPDGKPSYYSYKTCQDRTNYVAETRTWRFISAHAVPPPPAVAAAWNPLYPLLSKVVPVQREVNLAAGLQRQGTLKVTLLDLGRPGTDSNVPDLNPDKTGTKNSTERNGLFWRRFVAIHPNYPGIVVRLKRGFNTPTFATTDFETAWRGRLRSLNFNRDGTLSMEIEDHLGNFEKKLPPKVSKNNTLQATRSRNATSFLVQDASQYSDPTVTSAGYTVLQIPTLEGRFELAKCTARDTTTNLLTLTRGQFGTFKGPVEGDDTAEKVGAHMPEVLHWSSADGTDGVHPVEVVQDLLNRMGIATGDVDGTQMDAQKQWIGPVTVKRTITKSSQALKLLHELLELSQSALFIDDNLKIRLWTNRPSDPSDTVSTIADADIHERGVEFDHGEEQRLTHASLVFGYDGDKDRDAAAVMIYVSDEAFLADFFGATEDDRFERALKGGRWVQEWDDFQAATACARWAKENEMARSKVVFSADLRKEVLDVGEFVDLSIHDLQDRHGATRTVRCIVESRVREGLGRYKFTLEETGFGTQSGTVDDPYWAIIGPASLGDYDSESAANKAAYGFVTDANNQLGAANDVGHAMI